MDDTVTYVLDPHVQIAVLLVGVAVMILVGLAVWLRVEAEIKKGNKL